MRPKAIDIFSGVGGLSLGLELAGFDVVVDVEIEELTANYAKYNFPNSTVLSGDQGDATRFTKDTLASLGVDPKDIFLIAGGPPCQGFSNVGRRKYNDPLNKLVLHFARIVMEIKPRVFLMENVPGIKTSDSKMLESALQELSKCYRIHPPKTLTAYEYGVPQIRKRVFILGINKDECLDPTLPLPTHHHPSDNSFLTLPAPNVWDAISDIPDVDQYKELLSGDRIPYEVGPQTEYQNLLRTGQNAQHQFSVNADWDDTICTNLRRTQHGESLIDRFKQTKPGETEPKSRIKRLAPNELSVTIRAGTTKARGSWSAPRPLHPFHHRVLTTRECARIQSFPDWFYFHPAKWHGNRMVGNAVPPLMAEAIGSHVLKSFNISVQRRDNGMLKRDESIIAEDIERALKSNYENRNVSQQVISWVQRG